MPVFFIVWQFPGIVRKEPKEERDVPAKLGGGNKERGGREKL